MADRQESRSPQERQLIGLSTFLHLESEARKAKTVSELAVTIVNDTLKLFQYKQAVLCRKTFGNRMKITAVSGVDRPDPNAPYIIWLKKFFKRAIKKKKQDIHKLQEISGDQLPEKLKKGWQEWGDSNGIWCPLVTPDKQVVGGLWLVRDFPWQKMEKILLARLAGAYAHAWQPLVLKGSWRRARYKNLAGRIMFAIAVCGAAAAMALPVPLTVLAPAQVVPAAPFFVTAPLNGVIKRFYVNSYQTVEKGQMLFSLDDTDLKNRFEVAAKTLEVARADYKLARQKSLLDPAHTEDISLLKARVDQKQAEQKFIADELDRVAVASPVAGVTLFSDQNDWIGKPVSTGQKIMTLADPQQIQLEIQVPVDNAVNLETGTKVRLFLNTDPSIHISGAIEQTAYEAQVSSQGVLSFPVKARVDRGRAKLRVGQQGVAKIYGKQVRLYYYLFRRPWAAVRNTLGL